MKRLRIVGGVGSDVGVGGNIEKGWMLEKVGMAALSNVASCGVRRTA